MIHLEQPRGHVPLRVVAQMDEPIGYLGDLLHLDAPLSYGAYHALDLQTRKTIEPIETAEWPTDLTLPLSTWWVDYDPQIHGEVDPRLLKRRRRGKGGPPPQLWGWCASAAVEDGWIRSKLEIRKKPPIREMGRYTDAKTHNVSSGHMKAYDLAMPTVFAREIVWYAHGDQAAVQDLLERFVPALGKKRSTGSGTVRAWRVEPHVEDWSVLRDGAPMRRLPLGAVEGGASRSGSIRPPYYHHTRIVQAVEPC